MGEKWSNDPCGCWVRIVNGTITKQRCPLHAAASDLLRFVQSTRNFYELLEKLGEISEEERPVLEEARALVSKATMP